MSGLPDTLKKSNLAWMKDWRCALAFVGMALVLLSLL